MDILDPYREAKLLIDQHGQDGALIAALQRIQELGDVRDFAGVAAWDRIMDAIEDLRRTAPSDRGTLH